MENIHPLAAVDGGPCFVGGDADATGAEGFANEGGVFGADRPDGCGAAHAEEHRDSFVDGEGMEPAAVSAPTDERCDGERNVGRKLRTKPLEDRRVEGMLRGGGVEVDLEGADVGLLCGDGYLASGFGDDVWVGSEVWRGFDANDGHEPGVMGEEQGLAAQTDLHALSKQKFAREEGDADFRGVEVGEVFGSLPSPEHGEGLVLHSGCGKLGS